MAKDVLTADILAKSILQGANENQVRAAWEAFRIYKESSDFDIESVEKGSYEYETAMEQILILTEKILKGEYDVID